MFRVMRFPKWWISIGLAVGLGGVLHGHPADSAKQWVRITGGLEASAEVVLRDDNDPNTLQPTQYHAERLMLNATVVLFDQIYLPFHLYLGNGQVSYDQPFNQFGASLRLTKWLTLHGGFFSFLLSPLTFGDLRLEGGGVELNPGNFRMAMFYGRGRRARDPEPDRFFFGTYARWYWGLQMGYDNRAGAKALLTIMKAYDDSSTLTCSSAFCPKPQENFVTSLSVAVPVRRKVSWSSEAAFSAYSRDTRSPEAFDTLPYEWMDDWVEWLFVPRLSSAVDVAFQNKLFITPHPAWTVAVNADWIGPGYTTLGYVYLIGDVMRLTVSPSAILMQGKMSLSGSLGIERDNVLETRQETSRRLVGSFSGMYTATQRLSFSASYSNYGIRSYVALDSPRARIITQNLTVSPQLRSSFWGLSHMTIVSYSFSDMTDQNLLSGLRTNFRGHSVQLSHSMRPGRSWNATTSMYWIRNTALGAPSVSMGLNQLFSIPLAQQKMRVTIRGGISRQQSTINTSLTINTGLSASYNFERWGRLALRTAYRHTWSSYGGGRRISDFRGSLSYSIFFK